MAYSTMHLDGERFGLMIFVCAQHKDGSNKAYIHVPVNQIHFNLSSIEGPNLAHAAICPRPIQLIKLNSFSNTQK
jgi:hypothetical protein